MTEPWKASCRSGERREGSWLWWERTRQREGEVAGKSISLTSKAAFEPKVSVCLDWSSLSIMPLSTAMIHYPASLISVSQVRQEAGTDRRKYFASRNYAKHSLHTTTDGLSAHLSWTLNHGPGIHGSKFPMQYSVLRSVLFLPSFNMLAEFQGGPGRTVSLKVEVPWQECSSSVPRQWGAWLRPGICCMSGTILCFFHVKIQLLLQREETVGTRGGLMSVPAY